MHVSFEEAQQIIAESIWTFLKVLPMVAIFLVIMAILFFGLRSFGLIGSTIVERKVFTESFQYKEGMAQRAAMLEASIVEIDILLQTNPENRQGLVNQKTILKAQLRAITINEDY